MDPSEHRRIHSPEFDPSGRWDNPNPSAPAVPAASETPTTTSMASPASATALAPASSINPLLLHHRIAPPHPSVFVMPSATVMATTASTPQHFPYSPTEPTYAPAPPAPPQFPDPYSPTELTYDPPAMTTTTTQLATKKKKRVVMKKSRRERVVPPHCIIGGIRLDPPAPVVVGGGTGTVVVDPTVLDLFRSSRRLVCYFRDDRYPRSHPLDQFLQEQQQREEEGRGVGGGGGITLRSPLSPLSPTPGTPTGVPTGSVTAAATSNTNRRRKRVVVLEPTDVPLQVAVDRICAGVELMDDKDLKQELPVLVKRPLKDSLGPFPFILRDRVSAGRPTHPSWQTSTPGWSVCRILHALAKARDKEITTSQKTADSLLSDVFCVIARGCIRKMISKRSHIGVFAMVQKEKGILFVRHYRGFRKSENVPGFQWERLVASPTRPQSQYCDRIDDAKMVEVLLGRKSSAIPPMKIIIAGEVDAIDENGQDVELKCLTRYTLKSAGVAEDLFVQTELMGVSSAVVGIRNRGKIEEVLEMSPQEKVNLEYPQWAFFQILRVFEMLRDRVLPGRPYLLRRVEDKVELTSARRNERFLSSELVESVIDRAISRKRSRAVLDAGTTGPPVEKGLEPPCKRMRESNEVK